MIIQVFLAIGGFMAGMLFAAQRAEQIFTVGPENLVANSTVILAGPVSGISKQVISITEPPDSNASPLKWIVSGRIDSPRVLKGSANGPVKFSRQEQDIALPPSRDRNLWEDDYLYFHEGDSAIIFENSDHSPIKVLPSGTGKHDLASLVSDIIAIEAGVKGERSQAWLSYLNDARMEQGRKSALRVLVQMPIGWKEFAPVLDRVLSNTTLSDDMRSFTFGIVVYGLTQGAWKPDQASVADFLTRQFQSERNPRLLLSYILSLKLALRYSMEQPERMNREPIKMRIVNCLQQKESIAAAIPELAEQYRQIRAAYPGIL